MPSHALTDISIRALSNPKKGQTTYWDASMSGFGVRISQGGTKTFVVVHGVERRRFTIGRYPAITLKQARDKAKELQAGLTLGLIDKRPSPPYLEALALYLEASSLKNRPGTVSEYRRMLTTHFAFGRKRLNEITRADIQTKLNRLKDTPSEQRHAFVAMKVFLNWAVREEYLSSNPIISMQPPSRQRSRERVLQPEELAEIYKKACDCPWPYGPIVQLLALTGQRRGEIGGLRWSWIDQDKRLISFPANFTKNRRLHVLPYGEQVAEVLKNLPEHVGSDFVFPGRKSGASNFNSWSKSKRAFDVTLKGVEPYVLHDLRRTYSSTLAQLGTPIHVTEKLLNHVSGTISGVAAIYNRHSYLEEMREAVENFETYLGNIITQPL
ncbi:tyrosine-type recombinase/integrase [Parasphingorhabdus halotolerans]|uniref:Tyrosine-type recombinase/integrase n=1 Tax=Parasphingorhabdus halotolerans TaxID=2725558 RepID=A0A6H2DRV2_9SPHN|nr:tyrosine-type recombinase/integrase [Parasphingorhabdus halotolerans]QJB70713.1 tyrosine-type recombinase/integrase [Parasphingorhabdus halotolerans]